MSVFALCVLIEQGRFIPGQSTMRQTSMEAWPAPTRKSARALIARVSGTADGPWCVAAGSFPKMDLSGGLLFLLANWRRGCPTNFRRIEGSPVSADDRGRSCKIRHKVLTLNQVLFGRVRQRPLQSGSGLWYRLWDESG
jgi:hypothetical protein